MKQRWGPDPSALALRPCPSAPCAHRVPCHIHGVVADAAHRLVPAENRLLARPLEAGGNRILDLDQVVDALGRVDNHAMFEPSTSGPNAPILRASVTFQPYSSAILRARSFGSSLAEAFLSSM